MRKNTVRALLCFAIVSLLTAAPASPASEGYGRQKVVYHFNKNDFKTTAAGLKNIQNHFKAVGEMDLDVVAVFHGGGVLTLALEPEKAEDRKLAEVIRSRIVDLKSRGVRFNVCSNTLRGKKIDYKKDLYDVKESDIVPSGVAEISKLQLEGYTYIKP